MESGCETTDRSRLRFALVLTGIVFVAELVTGLLTGSLALVADSAHMFLDTFAVGLGLIALYLANLPATEKRTFGWHRAEVLTALLNGLLLTVVSVEIFLHGWERYGNPHDVIVLPMIGVAGVGLVTNILVALRLRHGKREDINMRGVYLHVLGDLMASVAVVAGGVMMLVTGLMWIDSVLAMGIACLVLFGALRLLRDALHLLLEGVPRHLQVGDVSTAIAGVRGVVSVHDVHVWAICSHILSLSCHVRVDGDVKNAGIIQMIDAMLEERFSIVHCTIQIDETPEEGEPMISQDLRHGSAHVHEH